MKQENVILVVPKPYHSSYPIEKRNELWTIDKFVKYVREMEGIS